MGADGRKTAETSKKVDANRRVKDKPDEYEDIADEIHQVRTSWTTSSVSDCWKRIEQTGLDNSLKLVSRVKGELTLVSDVSKDVLCSFSNIAAEFGELLNCIRISYLDNEKEIFDGDEREKRYLRSTCPRLVELWSTASCLAIQATKNLVCSKGWSNDADQQELLRAYSGMAAESVKLIVLTLDQASCHSQDDADELQITLIGTTEAVVEHIRVLSKTESEVEETLHTVIEPLHDLIGWELYGVWHILENVLKPRIEAKKQDDDLDHLEDLMKTLSFFEKDTHGAQDDSKVEVEEPRAQQEITPEKKTSKDAKGSAKGSRNNKKTSKEVMVVKEVKTESPAVPENNKRSKQDCLSIIQKFGDHYQRVSNEAWENKRLPVVSWPSGAKIQYRMDSYREIGKVRIETCPMPERKEMMNSLALKADQSLFANLYTFAPSGIKCNHEIKVQFPIMNSVLNEKDSVVVKVKVDGKWLEISEPEKSVVNEAPVVCFAIQNCEAFTAVVQSLSDICVVSPQGTTYTNDEHDVEIHFPEGTVDNEITLRIKTVQFDKQEEDLALAGIVKASVGVEISSAERILDFKKQIRVQLALQGELEDRETKVVLARYNDDEVQILDKKQVILKQVKPGVFSLESKEHWCYALLRIKRIFINMKESVKREFLTGFGKAVRCNIITYIDHFTREGGKMKFVVEVAEKCHAEASVELKKNEKLIEIKKSRSKDILVKQCEQIRVTIDGQIRPSEALPDEHYVICFIRGASNILHVPAELKRDSEKHPDAVLAYTSLPGDKPIHSFAIMTRDLAELETDAITARQGVTVQVDVSKKERNGDEAAVKILQHESLMSLAREMTFMEAKLLGEQLGVKPEKIEHIKESNESDVVSANFQILCDWRGTRPRTTMADFLVSSLRAVGQTKHADVVTEAWKINRTLHRRDFEKKPKNITSKK
ncbi:hypothetical protein ACJMK2_024330 [Sinanodonta woodiana]|uniref:Death domain-containing protein n=1 Tax=Sinanodonta woodiana TaxID=1069815 RepID=A0ABD3T8W4_SINWO